MCLSKDAQEKLIAIFHELDEDRSGTIGTEELRKALSTLGVPRARASKLLCTCDKSGDGNIDFAEWEKVVSNSTNKEFSNLAELLISKRESQGAIFIKPERERWKFMLHPESRARHCWDTLLVILLMYIAIMTPFLSSFGNDFESERLELVEEVVAYAFIVDIFINFRTGYYDCKDVIMDPKTVACHYLRGWFIVDLVSSLPMQNLAAFKVSKLFKVVRLSKLLEFQHKFRNGQLGQVLDDLTSASHLQMAIRPATILLYLLLFCHWLACFLKFSGPGYLMEYQDVSGNPGREYLAALYWAMTTMTTVGYGDITPKSDWERVFAMVGMAVGGSFYGYVIGTISSIVSNRDLNRAAYQHRLDNLQAWLEHHRFPKDMRKRIRSYLKEHLSERAAIDVAEIMHDLSPELREDVGNYLLHDDVKTNPLFDGISTGILAHTLHLIQKVTAHADAVVVRSGEPGTAMFILIKGTATYERPSDDVIKTLSPGDSFGEEIVLQVAESYTYSVVADTYVVCFMIPEDGFLNCFATMPDVVARMRENHRQNQNGG